MWNAEPNKSVQYAPFPPGLPVRQAQEVHQDEGETPLGTDEDAIPNLTEIQTPVETVVARRRWWQGFSWPSTSLYEYQ